MRILVTSEDGVYSPGLRLLYQFAEPLGEVDAVAPETPKSASGLGITLHKPLRMYEMDICGFKVVATSGTPSDTIYLALYGLGRNYDLVLSGINLGDNTSLQVVLSSGTLGAAFQAALLGIPAVAYSLYAESWDKVDEEALHVLRAVVQATAKYVAERDMPQGVDVISVNFSRRPRRGVRAKLAKPAKLRYAQRVEARRDPRGAAYFWLYGEPLSPEPETDVYVVLKEGNMVITPLALNLDALGYGRRARKEELEALVEYVNAHL